MFQMTEDTELVEAYPLLCSGGSCVKCENCSESKKGLAVRKMQAGDYEGVQYLCHCFACMGQYDQCFSVQRQAVLYKPNAENLFKLGMTMLTCAGSEHDRLAGVLLISLSATFDESSRVRAYEELAMRFDMGQYGLNNDPFLVKLFLSLAENRELTMVDMLQKVKNLRSGFQLNVCPWNNTKPGTAIISRPVDQYDPAAINISE